MKFGILTFSYANFAHFGQALARAGHYTVNLGDNAQSIATRALYRRLGIADADIVDIDRDTLPTYAGEEVAVLMNAVFRPDGFPIPDTVHPIFVGFTARPEAMAANADYLRKWQPIGCRDRVTAELLSRLGVEAFVSGCVTLTLDQRQREPPAQQMFVVHGAGSGDLPRGLLRHAPPDLLDTAQFVAHRLPVFEHPLSPNLQRAAEGFEASVMRRLAAQATLVVTPLHHVAAPAMAMGIPTIIARIDRDSRFSFLEEITPIYTTDTLDRIDWSPAPLDLRAVADAFAARVRAKIGAFDQTLR